MTMGAVTVSDLDADVFDDIRRSGTKDLLNTGCVIMSKKLYERIMDELADYVIEREAAKRIKDGSKRLYTEKEVMEELGITEEDLAAVGDVEIE